MLFKHHVPILCSADVRKSIEYYTTVLGFEHHWEWETPPTFGGVSKDGVEIFFCKDGQGHPGTWLSIFVQDTDAYHEEIVKKGAKIVSPPQTMEWGIREMLVEDPDGHKIRFGHHAHHNHPGSSSPLPAGVQIVKRTPTEEEYRALIASVKWTDYTNFSVTEKSLGAALFAVVAEVNGQAIGCALLLGDGASFYYIKDVMVHPDWQCKHIGTAMMHELMSWLETNAPDKSLAGLYTGENLTPFYKQFGFRPAFGMHRRINKEAKK